MTDKFKNYVKSEEYSTDVLSVMVEEGSLPLESSMVVYQIAWESQKAPSGIRKYMGKTSREFSERLMEHINKMKGFVDAIYVSVIRKCNSEAELSFYERLYIHSSAKRIIRSAFGCDVEKSAKTSKVVAKYMTNEFLT